MDELIEKLEGAVTKLEEIVETLRDNDTVEFPNLDTKAQAAVDAVDALYEELSEALDDSDDNDDETE